MLGLAYCLAEQTATLIEAEVKCERTTLGDDDRQWYAREVEIARQVRDRLREELSSAQQTVRNRKPPWERG